MSFLDAHNLTSKCSSLTQETKLREQEVIDLNADSKDQIFKIELDDDGEFRYGIQYDFWKYSDQSWLWDRIFSESRFWVLIYTIYIIYLSRF